MGSQPLVSVIIIFLNAEKFMQEAVESVFAQTYDNWELLLVDDGSTDTSREMALRYAEQYPAKVHYLEHTGHQNRGMSASRNLGISTAKGSHIAFLDADDVWLPHKLEQQVAILEFHPEAAMVYGPAQVWFGWTGNPKDIQRDFVKRNFGVQPDTLIKPPTLLPLLLRNQCVEPLPSGILVRRAVIDSIGGFEETFRGMFEDLVFDAKLCLEAPVFVASECWYRFRRHPDSCSTVVWNTGQYDSEWLTFLTWLEGYLSKRGLQSGEVWKVVREKLLPVRHPILHLLLRRIHHFVTGVKELLKLILQQTLPFPVYRWLQVHWHHHTT